MVLSSATPSRRSDEGSNPSAAFTRVVRDAMGDTWHHEPKFFQKFFPVTRDIKVQCPDIKKRLYNYSNSRWKGIPRKPKSVSSLSTNIVFLLDRMLEGRGIYDKRRFFKTQSPKLETFPHALTSPTILLAGAGPEFVNTGIDLPFAQYAQGIAPFEARINSPDITHGHGRLAVHMHEMFSHQHNRRFAFGVVITEQILTVSMFDHSGAIFSDPLDYHNNPEQFCAIILELASLNASRVGFDVTMYSADNSSKIRTTEFAETKLTRLRARQKPAGIVYTIKEGLFRFRTIVSTGTLCWLVQDDLSEQEYVIKDAWIAVEELPGRESEGSLLRHVQKCGITQGVAQIRHFEEVPLGDDTSVVDKISRNRRASGTNLHSVERVHTRLVLSTYGKPLDEFSSPKELLFAFHDAVLAHRRLYEIAGVLHRDISVRNILIKPDGEEGNRGILIDFDHAIQIGDKSAYASKRKIVRDVLWGRVLKLTGLASLLGNVPYLSRNVLEEGPHTHLDDLESFFYVLCFIVVGYTSPGSPTLPHPEIFEGWEHRVAWPVKQGFISQPFDLTISPWFGGPLRRLCIGLHSFFRTRNRRMRDAEEIEQTLLHVPSVDYDEYLSHIRQAIADMNLSEASQFSEVCTSFVGQKHSSRPPIDDPSDAPEPPKSLKKAMRRAAPIVRPRRRKGHYKF